MWRGSMWIRQKLVHRSFRVALVAVALVGVYIPTGCFCNIARPLDKPPHSPEILSARPLLGLPPGCAVIRFSEGWRTKVGDRIVNSEAVLNAGAGYGSGYLENWAYHSFRQSRKNPSTFYVAVSTPYCVSPCIERRDSGTKYSFEWPYMAGASDGQVHSVAIASEQEWQEAEVIHRTLPPVWNEPQPDRWYNGSYHVASRTGRKVVVFRTLGGPLQFAEPFYTIFLRDIFFPPSLIRLALFDAQTERRESVVLLWGCWTTLDGLEYATWHGDRIFSMRLDYELSQVLVCGIRERTAQKTR